MNSNSKKPKQLSALPLWTHPQAQRALPYLSAVVRSLRDHGLEVRRWRRLNERLAKQPGPRDRTQQIEFEEAQREQRQAETRFQESLQELHNLGVFCDQALRGQVLLPFVHGRELAWFIYDLFDPEPLQFWRYHSDPSTMRRPLEDETASKTDTLVV